MAVNPTARGRRDQGRIAAALGQIGFALPGSITQRYTRCGRPSCRCKADPPRLHGPYLQWTRKHQGKTITRLLTTEQAAQLRSYMKEDDRLRELVQKLEALTVELVERAQGWQPPTPRTRSAAARHAGRADRARR